MSRMRNISAKSVSKKKIQTHLILLIVIFGISIVTGIVSVVFLFKAQWIKLLICLGLEICLWFIFRKLYRNIK